MPCALCCSRESWAFCSLAPATALVFTRSLVTKLSPPAPPPWDSCRTRAWAVACLWGESALVPSSFPHTDLRDSVPSLHPQGLQSPVLEGKPTASTC